MSKEPQPQEIEESGGIVRFIYYILLFCIVFGVLFSQQEDNGPKVVFGYGVFHVLSKSMEPEIPKESLVITKKVDFNNLGVGDDITFLVGPVTSITHRVINVIENHNETGERVLETQGVANGKKDNEVVYEQNIVGKVIFTNYYLGKIAIFLKKYWHILLIYMIGYIVLKKIVLKKIDNEDDEEEELEIEQNNEKIIVKRRKRRDYIPHYSYQEEYQEEYFDYNENMDWKNDDIHNNYYNNGYDSLYENSLQISQGNNFEHSYQQNDYLQQVETQAVFQKENVEWLNQEYCDENMQVEDYQQQYELEQYELEQYNRNTINGYETYNGY